MGVRDTAGTTVSSVPWIIKNGASSGLTWVTGDASPYRPFNKKTPLSSRGGRSPMKATMVAARPSKMSSNSLTVLQWVSGSGVPLMAARKKSSCSN